MSSVGFARGPTLPETTTGMYHVRVFRHALSLDELRLKFLPEYANGGLGPSVHGRGAGSGNVKEVWFVGSHSDMYVVFRIASICTNNHIRGGGNVYNLKLERFGPPLRWMLYEAMEFGLRVKPLQVGKWAGPAHNPSMNRFWKIMEYIPVHRLSYGKGEGDETKAW